MIQKIHLIPLNYQTSSFTLYERHYFTLVPATWGQNFYNFFAQPAKICLRLGVATHTLGTPALIDYNIYGKSIMIFSTIVPTHQGVRQQKIS